MENGLNLGEIKWRNKTKKRELAKGKILLLNMEENRRELKKWNYYMCFASF